MRYVAFLRAINVGGRNVKMDALRLHFEALGLAGVSTFIASGNVIFETRSKDLPSLEKKIEARLLEKLGYEVKTFLRSEDEVAAIAGRKLFPPARLKTAGAFCVAFLAAPLTPAALEALSALKNSSDDFAADGREVYWLCRTRQSESEFSNAVFEKKVGVRATFRGMKTMTKLAALLGGPL